jgi:demethylmenaquinone methyltransferase / 2-methoxy-6-polyprenyl-1,4-benzoquinol methylase
VKYTKDKKFIGSMFDEISPTYDKLNHLLSGYQDTRWRKQAVKFLASTGSTFGKVIDLASGSGDLGQEFQNLKPKRIYSVDLSHEMLKIDREKLDSSINRVLKAEAEFLPFRDEQFDLCGIGFGVRNFQNLDKCITEIARVLKPGAYFVTIEMFKPVNRSVTARLFKQYFEKVLPKIGNRLSNSSYAYEYLFESVDNFLPVNMYSEMLEERGFRSIKIKNNFLGIVHSVFAQKV